MPRPRFVFAAAVLAVCPPLYAQSATFASLSEKSGLQVQRFDVDFPHSAIEFSVRFMGLSRVRGAFSEFTGTLMYDPADLTRSSVSIVINVASINTNVASRDRDLKGPSFFDAEKFPRITFRSTAVKRQSEGYAMSGTLTMHGVTREVTIPFKLLHALSKDAWGNQRIGFVGGLTVSRKEYGILGTAFWNSEFDPGRMSISDEVQIDLTLEAELNNVERWTTPKGDSVLAVADQQGIAKTLEQFRTAAADTTTDAGRFTEGIMLTVGTKLMHRGRFADAVAAYALAAQLKPDRSSLHAGLGEAYLLAGKRAEAIASFKRAVALSPENTVAAEYLRVLSAG